MSEPRRPNWIEQQAYGYRPDADVWALKEFRTDIGLPVLAGACAKAWLVQEGQRVTVRIQHPYERQDGQIKWRVREYLREFNTPANCTYRVNGILQLGMLSEEDLKNVWDFTLEQEATVVIPEGD